LCGFARSGSPVMMGVMSNTSPLTHLAAIGYFDLLRPLYGQLLIAEAVWEELNAGDQAAKSQRASRSSPGPESPSKR